MFSVLFVALMLITIGGHASPHGGHDCVVQMLTTAGIGNYNAHTYAKRIAQADVEPDELKDAISLTLRVVGIDDEEDQQRFIACYSSSVGDSERPSACVGYSPCTEHSRCTAYSAVAKPHFLCKDYDGCHDNPCLNAGKCKAVDKTFTCDCAIGYTGRRCEEKWQTKAKEEARLANVVTAVGNSAQTRHGQSMAAIASLRSLVEGLVSIVSGIDSNVKASKSVLIPSKRYVAYSEDLSWDGARDACKARGGTLAVIRNAEENAAFTAAAASPNPNFWIGANDRITEGTYEWITGDPFTFTNWRNGEPNNGQGVEHCIHVNDGAFMWNDISCSSHIGYVCQFV
ncbi:sushi, nidogen and EGF-like domain-containing protein 1 [Sycon ciliatum]|uniref:sushi, nidogen and EGF-like domain-containing protein 1 n=1 Tax=Sycon ciliatum TaxID=27933 RepID=UPI0031F6B982